MIQGLLSSSGQQVAQQRAVQLQGYVNTQTLKPADTTPFSSQPVQNTPLSTNVQPFQEVLQSTANQFGTLLTPLNSTTNVQGQISPIQPASSVAQPSKPQLLSMISQIAKKHGVDEKLVKAVIRQESGFNTKATSHCGAKGLMQLMPSTAKTLGVTDPYNPVQNVDGGVRHLKWLLSKYNGNVILAVAAYNAGSGAVDKYDGVPPYKETQNYVKNILRNYLG